MNPTIKNSIPRSNHKVTPPQSGENTKVKPAMILITLKKIPQNLLLKLVKTVRVTIPSTIQLIPTKIPIRTKSDSAASFKSEKTKIPADEQEKFNNLPNSSSHIYLAIGGTLAAVICIKDPVREEAKQVIADLHALGIKKVVMMTGDSKRNAQRVADELGIDEVHAEVLPEDKASYVKQAKADGYTVMMVGDGINDSPAISEAHVGIAMNEGAPIAQKIANVTISSDNLQALVDLRRISIALMKRIKANYNGIVGFNGALVGGGVLGIMPPSQTAWLHNLFTLGIGLESMTPLLKKDEPKETVPTIDVTADSVVA